MKKILHPFDQKFYCGSGERLRFFPVYIVITDERGYLSFTGVQAPTLDGNAKGGSGQINMEYNHRNPAENDTRYSTPIMPDELRFSKDWDVDTWYSLLHLWHEYHLKRVESVPEIILSLLNALPDTDRTPIWC